MRKATNPLGRLAIAAGTAVMLGLAPAAFANETVALKNALYGAGYEIKNVSPEMDDATRAALTSFQKDNGLQATGSLNQETKKALGMVSVQVAAASSTSTTSQPASASSSAESAQSAPAEEATTEDEAIEEEDDGGWSLW